jgi:hypothetical protein
VLYEMLFAAAARFAVTSAIETLNAILRERAI